MPSWSRWIFFLIATWSTCMLWAEDPLARSPRSPHWPVYWTLIAVIGAAALVFEVRDIVKKKAD